MNGFFDRLGRELHAAAKRRAREPRFSVNPLRRWSPRAAAITALLLALGVVPAIGAVTRVLDSSSPQGDVPPPSREPVVVDLGPGCSGPVPDPPPPSTEPPPAELVRILGVLRRPQREVDKLPARSPAPSVASGVNPDATRLAHRARDGTRMYVVPAQNIHYRPPVPNTPACKRFREPRRAPQAGACLIEILPGGAGGANCQSADKITEGFLIGSTSSGRGRRHTSGVAPDGVTEVTLRFRGGKRRTVPVRDNLFFATHARGTGGRPLIYFREGAEVRLVGRKPPSRAARARQRAAHARSERRDRTAGARPSVVPPRGDTRQVFTFRMRVNPRRRALYVLEARGPRDAPCDAPHRYRIGIHPATRGAKRGLLKAALAHPRGAWCPGHYEGTVLADRPGTGRRVLGRFRFEIRE